MKQPKVKLNVRYPVKAIEAAEELELIAGPDVKNSSVVSRAIYALGLSSLRRLKSEPDKLAALINRADAQLTTRYNK